jgi:DNA-3-methyladenine glycosylase II
MTDALTIEKHLSKRDKVLSRLIKQFGSSPIATAKKRNPFDSLVSSVISQQLSSTVSSVIKKRLAKVVGRRPFKPENILNAKEELLRGCGISSAKIKTIKGIAKEAVKGKLDLKHFKDLTDDEVIAYLSSFWGVGKWTAEMFLMFTLNRLDVLPLNDAGLNRAHGILYPNAESFSNTAEEWKPFRTVGCWYMWKHIDNP